MTPLEQTVALYTANGKKWSIYKYISVLCVSRRFGPPRIPVVSVGRFAVSALVFMRSVENWEILPAGGEVAKRAKNTARGKHPVSNNGSHGTLLIPQFIYTCSIWNIVWDFVSIQFRRRSVSSWSLSPSGYRGPPSEWYNNNHESLLTGISPNHYNLAPKAGRCQTRGNLAQNLSLSLFPSHPAPFRRPLPPWADGTPANPWLETDGCGPISVPLRLAKSRSC